MRFVRCLVIGFLGVAQPVLADAPTVSIFPVPRPVVGVAASVPETPPVGLIHPLPRPVGVQVALPKSNDAVPEMASVRPKSRPDGLAARQADVVDVAADVAPAVSPGKKAKASKKGSVCGDPAIRGEVLAQIGSKTKGCGVEDPVRVTSIDGVKFSQPATIDCKTAIAFKKWIQNGVRPAFGNREVVGLHIYGSYMCRTRNNVRGAKVSEHGRGKAIDVAGFIFSDGREWTIKRDYNKQIRKAQKAACGIFGTTLGPGSDGYHEDHLHFDTASHGNGSYCR